MKMLRSVLYLFCLFLLPILTSCNRFNCGDNPNLNACGGICNRTEPSGGTMIVNLSIQDKEKGTPLTVFKKSIDGEVIFSDTVKEESITISVPKDVEIIAVADYSERDIKSVDAGKITYSLCECTCYVQVESGLGGSAVLDVKLN